MNTRNGGAWTDAKFHNFLMNALRDAHRRWGPKYAAMNAASIDKSTFLCAGCKTAQPKTFPKGPTDKKRPVNRYCDHIEPVVDQSVGHQDYDTVIHRMFSEADGYQALCKECHAALTSKERKSGNARRKKEKALAKKASRV